MAERLAGGRYVEVEIERLAAARYGLNIADVQTIVSGAIGGANVARTVEGLARYPVNVRYPREIRDSVDEIRALPVLTPSRSEEHTSELQSLMRISYAVFCFKKKNKSDKTLLTELSKEVPQECLHRSPTRI